MTAREAAEKMNLSYASVLSLLRLQVRPIFPEFLHRQFLECLQSLDLMIDIA